MPSKWQRGISGMPVPGGLRLRGRTSPPPAVSTPPRAAGGPAKTASHHSPSPARKVRMASPRAAG
eukprot:13324708-Alexandrium_andersonii.AAC.1